MAQYKKHHYKFNNAVSILIFSNTYFTPKKVFDI